MKDRQWQKWTVQDWNEALFEHFFLDSDGEDRPVHRIPVTGDELLKIVGDPTGDADEVQKAFLTVIRTSSHIEFNHRISRYPTDPQVGWRGAGIPPFFAELAFSCLVASPSDGEIRDEGNFRSRLALIMNHDLSSAKYPLDTLATLWKAFGRWLNTRRAAGSRYRRLELPPPDHRVRIGYSIKLAFPSRKDMENLIRVLSSKGLTADPPIPTVLALVGKAYHNFSPGFCASYDEFRFAYRTRKTDLDQYPFWGAIREALDSVEDARPGAAEDAAVLLLVMEPGGMVLLLSDAQRELVKGQLSFVKADTPYGEFRNVLCVGRDFEQGIQNATHMMLQGQYRGHLTGKGWSSIRVAIEQGVLLFMKTERLSWELVFTLQEEEGDYQVLIKDSLAPALLSAYHEDRPLHPRASRYPGWKTLGRFRGKWLASLSYDDTSPLAGIRCLQPTVRGARLSLVGGCSIDGGYLGIPECLPSVRAPFSTKVELVPLEPKRCGDFLRLARLAPDSVEFAFPSDFKTTLEGHFCFVGSVDDRVLVRKEVVFRPDIVVNDYARPTNPDAWLVEAGGPDIITFAESCRRERENIDRSGAKENGGRDGGTPSTETSVQSLSKTGILDWQRFISPILPGFHTCGDLDDFRATGRLMEIYGGLAMRRRGLPEAEFLEFLQKTLTVDRYRLWDVVRAWVEAGYLDRLMSRNWQRTEYFPRIPRFVLDQNGSQVRGALPGLATSSLRRRVDVDLLERGAKRIETLSFSEWLPPIPMWVAQDAKAFEEVSRSLALEEPTWVRPITEALWTLSKVTSCKQDPPRFYYCWGCWDWKRGGFVRETKPSGHGVEVIRFLHRERPPFYQVLADGEHVWWSMSRNWALLLAHDLLGVPCFALFGSEQVVRSVRGQVHLPLPIARYLAVTCPVSSGPVCDRPGAYCYQFRDSSERSRIAAAIWGGTKIPVEELRRWGRWMLDLSKRPPANFDGRSIPLPTSVKLELDRFPDVPEFQELSRSRFDLSLLPRLRDGLSRLTKDRGD